MKATELLEQQHRRVEALFDELESGGADASGLLERLANELASHMAIEQNIFYPAVRDCDEVLVAASFEEHAIAELALKRLLRAGVADPTFEAKLAMLRELIENHIDEEERDLFRTVEGALGDERLEKLGKRMKKALESARSEGFVALVPRGFARTSADEARKAFAVEATHDGRHSHVQRP
jgi:hypothetical protein